VERRRRPGQSYRPLGAPIGGGQRREAGQRDADAARAVDLAIQVQALTKPIAGGVSA
jgi:hypothetical protein